MQVEAKFDRDLIWYRGDSTRYLRVRVTEPGAGGASEQLPLNLALAVDASGSMSGERLRCAIDAATRVVECLTSADRLSLVSFGSTVTDHLSGVAMNDAGRRLAWQLLQEIRLSGCTNLFGGWMRGAQHVATAMNNGSPMQHRVVILSDGHANEGETDPAKLAEHAKQLASRGLTSSTVGIGDGYNSETLESIAVQGGGLHHRAAEPREIVEVLTAELEEARMTRAQGVQITLRHTAGVQVRSLNEFPLERGPQESTCEVGSLTAGASRPAIFSVKFPPGEPGVIYPLGVEVTWRRPSEAATQQATPLAVAARFARGTENNAQTHDAVLTHEVAQMWQARIVRRIVRLNREGRYSEAMKRLNQDIPRFTRYAERAHCRALTAELQRLRESADREWNEGSRKEIEIAMHKRAYSRLDARQSQEHKRNWSDILPDR